MAAVKALQQWCRIQCEGYRDVSITNMTTSFRDGLAFCALIHKHRSDLIDFNSLKKEDVYENNKLAFKVAEEQLGIPALLDAEDMLALRVPDRLSILTYVSQYYNYFHGRSPIGGMAGIKRPAETISNEPPGKKNQAVTAKVFPGSKPARENSPPRSANITKPSPSPKQIRNSTQVKDVHVEKSHQAGTLSNKCVSCDKHVHLVQRHLVEGKLYHRNCAKSLSTNTSSPFRDLPTNTQVSKFSPQPDLPKPATVNAANTPSKLGLTRLTEKPNSPPNSSSSFSASPFSQPASAPASAVKKSPTVSVSKPAAPSDSTFTTSISTKPTAAPQISVTASKTRESKMKFFQSDATTNHDEKKTSVFSTTVNKGQTVSSKGQEVSPGQSVTVVVNVKDVDKGRVAAKTPAAGNKVSTNVKEYDNKTKASAAALISKKLTEENNNNNSKPSWTNVSLKKTDKPQRQEETPKKETGGVRGRVKLKANPSLLADLQIPEPEKPVTSSVSWSGGADKTPDRGSLKPPKTSPNTIVSENASPTDWRSKLKPISKETKPIGPPQSPPKMWSNGATKPSEPSVCSPPISASSSLSTPASKGFQNGSKEQIKNGTKSESKNSKTKPGYIPKEDLMKELKEIEENLNELERVGVELELKLRKSEEEGDDDALMDELMVDWFSLIRNKQVAMRRESELVYIGRTQDLEEEQPSVDQELRRLMEKPEHLKTIRDKEREKQLMEKLIAIVNDRNAIVEGLDEDRLREEEEDEELNKMMMSFIIKRDKTKRKSQKFKLFSWGNKKEA